MPFEAMKVEKSEIYFFALELMKWGKRADPSDQDYYEQFVKKIAELGITRALHWNHWICPDCGVTYTGNSMELRTFALALASLSWLTFLLHQKTHDGHCHAHKGASNTPITVGKRRFPHYELAACPEGSKCHRNMYDTMLHELESFLQIARENAPVPITKK